MYARLLNAPKQQSFFLFGPRGTGKSAWARSTFADAPIFDLLDSKIYTRLLANPSLLGELIPKEHRGWVVLDEIQRVPDLLNEVHRLIETRRIRFVLTGSSVRKLRRHGINLLAGRALTRRMHPLTLEELGRDFDLGRALRFGCLPFACTTSEPDDYLASYVSTYLREEVMQEGLVRNLGAFSRFLETASFSQGSTLNMAAVAREAGVHAKVVEDYFDIVEDLLIAERLPVFTKRAKRRLVAHPKFYFFDTGAFRAVRPRGPLDSPEEVEGPALETLLLAQLRAYNDYHALGYAIAYWRTADGHEVDFILYGERGIVAIEAKRSARVRSEDSKALRLFREDYPRARAYLLHLGNERWHEAGVEIVPVEQALTGLGEIL